MVIIHFENDRAQNYSVFQPNVKYFKFLAKSSTITERKSKGLSKESIKLPTSDNKFLQSNFIR